MQVRSFPPLKYFNVLESNARMAEGLQAVIQQEIDNFEIVKKENAHRNRDVAEENIKLKGDFQIKSRFEFPRGSYLPEISTSTISGWGQVLVEIPTASALDFSRKAEEKALENLGRLLDARI